jgi:hypothetical protein
MSLFVPPPPPGGLEVINKALGDLGTRPSTAARAMEDAAPEDIAVAAPHPVYFLGLEDVASGGGLSAAKLVSWRYILLNGDNSLAAAEVSLEEGEGLEFSHVNQGPFVGATVEGVGIAEGLDEVSRNDYELRLLKIPGLYIVALWLHADQQDILIPLAPAPSVLTPNIPYSETDFIEAVQPAASNRLQHEEDDLAGG